MLVVRTAGVLRMHPGGGFLRKWGICGKIWKIWRCELCVCTEEVHLGKGWSKNLKVGQAWSVWGGRSAWLEQGVWGRRGGEHTRRAEGAGLTLWGTGKTGFYLQWAGRVCRATARSGLLLKQLSNLMWAAAPKKAKAAVVIYLKDENDLT